MTGNEACAQCHLGTRRSAVCGFSGPQLPPGADSRAALGKACFLHRPPAVRATQPLHVSDTWFYVGMAYRVMKTESDQAFFFFFSLLLVHNHHLCAAVIPLRALPGAIQKWGLNVL